MVFFIGWVLGVGALQDYLARTYDLNSILAQRQGDLEQAEIFARKSLLYRSNYMDPWNSLGAIEDIRAGLEAKPSRTGETFSTGGGVFRKSHPAPPPYSRLPTRMRYRTWSSVEGSRKPWTYKSN